MSPLKHCLLLLSLIALPSASLARHTPAKTQESKQKKKKDKSEKADDAHFEPIVPESLPQTEPPRPSNGSLFTEAALGNVLFNDFKARNVGDLVFIDVVEESAATVTSGAQRSRDSGTLAGLTGVISALPVPGAATTATAVGGLGARKYEGSGQTGRSSNLNARIAARVVEVLPNGDLRVEAKKVVKINKEDEMLGFSGIVRRRDITAANTVATTVVGDLRVTLNGKGVASADNAPGWLFRLFDKISPF